MEINLLETDADRWDLGDCKSCKNNVLMDDSISCVVLLFFCADAIHEFFVRFLSADTQVNIMRIF